MMNDESASEKCSCGASISVTAYSATSLRESLQAWREQHRHESPVALGAPLPRPRLGGTIRIRSRLPRVLVAPGVKRTDPYLAA